jgi:hypothetical protein
LNCHTLFAIIFKQKGQHFELSFLLRFLVFIVCEMVYQPAFFELPNVFLGGFVGNVEALSGF